MSRIYRLTDRIPIKLHDLVLTISPLTKIQKIDIETAGRDKDILKAGLNSTALAIKYAIKSMKGLKIM